MKWKMPFDREAGAKSREKSTEKAQQMQSKVWEGEGLR